MNGTTTRPRFGRRNAGDTGRVAATQPQRRSSRAVPATLRTHTHGVLVDGANALQIGYAEQAVGQPPAQLAEPSKLRGARRKAGTPARHPVVKQVPLALPRASYMAFLLGIVVVGVLGVLVLNTKINEKAFRLDELRGRQATLDLQEQQLTQDLVDRESPGNLAAAAKRLGLVLTTPTVISLPDGRVVGVPQPATGEPGITALRANEARR